MSRFVSICNQSLQKEQKKFHSKIKYKKMQNVRGACL